MLEGIQTACDEYLRVILEWDEDNVSEDEVFEIIWYPEDESEDEDDKLLSDSGSKSAEYTWLWVRCSLSYSDSMPISRIYRDIPNISAPARKMGGYDTLYGYMTNS